MCVCMCMRARVKVYARLRVCVCVLTFTSASSSHLPSDTLSYFFSPSPLILTSFYLRICEPDGAVDWVHLNIVWRVKLCAIELVCQHGDAFGVRVNKLDRAPCRALPLVAYNYSSLRPVGGAIRHEYAWYVQHCDFVGGFLDEGRVDVLVHAIEFRTPAVGREINVATFSEPHWSFMREFNRPFCQQFDVRFSKDIKEFTLHVLWRFEDRVKGGCYQYGRCLF